MMSHSFPSLDNGADRKPEESADGCDIFRPLYEDACLAGTLSHQPGVGSHQSDDDARNAEDRVHRNGFKRGFEDGRQDACRLAREEIVPEIKAFAVVFNQLNEYLHQLEDISSGKILEMAFSAAGKILGGAPHPEPAAFSVFKSELKALLGEAYQLRLTFNCRNMHTLSEYFRSENPEWQDCDRIKLDSLDQIPEGSLQAQPGGRSIPTEDNLDSLLHSLDKLLDAASTK